MQINYKKIVKHLTVLGDWEQTLISSTNLLFYNMQCTLIHLPNEFYF